jgi:hypothetical protein
VLAFLAALCSAFLLAGRAAAFGSGDDRGASGFKSVFLLQNVRSAALGGADCALPGNPLAVSGNPGSLADFDSRITGIATTDYVMDVLPLAVYAVFPTPYGVFSTSVGNVSYGSFERVSETAGEAGSFGANDVILRFGWARRWHHGLSGGVSIAWVRSTIDNYVASAAMMNIGLQWKAPGGGTVLGISAENMGGAFGSYIGGTQGLKDDVPTEFHIGALHSPAHFPVPLTLVGDVVLPRDNEATLSLGAEFQPVTPLFLRIGYESLIRVESSTAADNTHRGGLSVGDRSSSGFGGLGLAGGIGLVKHRTALDYSYSLAGAFGGVHRISLRYDWR